MLNLKYMDLGHKQLIYDKKDHFILKAYVETTRTADKNICHILKIIDCDAFEIILEAGTGIDGLNKLLDQAAVINNLIETCKREYGDNYYDSNYDVIISKEELAPLSKKEGE